jgi:hypothetical protein
MTSDSDTAPARPGWRYQLGRLMFIVPIPLVVIVPVVVPMLGMSAGATAATIGGILVSTEVIWFASIPLLGKEGFKKLEHGLFARLKPTAKPVSQVRHRVGVAMFFTALPRHLTHGCLASIWSSRLPHTS